MSHATLPELRPTALSPAQLAYLGFLARYTGLTHDGYRYHLDNWLAWCADRDLDPLVDVTRTHVELYIRWRQTELGNKPSTIGSVMSPIKGFYAFAVIDGHTDKNPAMHARTPRIHYDHTKKLGLDRSELAAFLRASERVSPRHYALGYLLGTMALRVSEACAVQIGDYADEIRGHRVLHLVGKGSKPATMPLPVPVLRALDAAKGDRTEGWLVTTLDGRQLQRSAAAGLVQTICRHAGITKHVSPHLLRHSAITNALDAGAPLRKVQDLARHTDPRVTMLYDRNRSNLDDHAVHTVSAFLSGY